MFGRKKTPPPYDKQLIQVQRRLDRLEPRVAYLETTLRLIRREV